MERQVLISSVTGKGWGWARGGLGWVLGKGSSPKGAPQGMGTAPELQESLDSTARDAQSGILGQGWD